MKFIFPTIFLLTILTGCGSNFEWFPSTTSATQVSITTTSLADAPSDLAYSRTLSASGGTGTYTWALASGTLPPGLLLSTAGIISGTPTAVTAATAGTDLYTFTVKATDTAATPATATRSISIFTPTSGRMYDPTLKVYGEGLSFDTTLGLTLNVNNTDSVPHTVQIVVANYNNTGAATGNAFNMTPVSVAAGHSVVATNTLFDILPTNNWRMTSVSIQ